MLTKRLLVVCLVALTVSVIGCAPKIVSSNAAVYQTGKLYASSGKDIDAVYQAATLAINNLQLKVTDSAKDAFGAKVRAKSSDEKNIVVIIKPVADKKTEYTIQVGAFGNEEQSRKIYAEIETALQGKAK
jgi:cell division protein FtsN